MRILRCIVCGRFLSEDDFNWTNKHHTKKRGSCKRCANYMLKLNGVFEKYSKTHRLERNKRAKEKRDADLEYFRKKGRESDRKRSKTKHRIEYKRKHKQEYRAHYTALQRERDAMKLNQTPDSYDREMVERLYLLSNIFTKDLWQPYHVDHIKPLSKGGEHRASNLQVVTAKQNLSKCNDEFSKLKGIRKQDLINHSEIFDLIESECAKVPFMNKPQGPLK